MKTNYQTENNMMDENFESNIVGSASEPVIIPPKERVVFFSKFDLGIAFACLIFSLVFLVYPIISNDKETAIASVVVPSQKTDPFANISIEAKSAYVIDLKSNKVLFEKNSEAQLPLASITKLMTAVTALSAVPEGTIITIDKDDLSLEGDSGLLEDERWRLGDLLGLTLIESSNDGAYAVASSIGIIEAGVSDKEIGRGKFIEMMNKKAKELGLAQTYFNNATGLDESVVEAGGYGSARDIAKLISYALSNYRDIFDSTKYSSLRVNSLNAPTHTATNTNKVLDGIPMIMASKTGYTDLAGGNLAVIFDAGINEPMAVVVLGSTLDGRFDDVKKLSWAAVDALKLQDDE